MQKPPISLAAVAGVFTKNKASVAPATATSSENLLVNMPAPHQSETLAWSHT